MSEPTVEQLKRVVIYASAQLARIANGLEGDAEPDDAWTREDAVYHARLVLREIEAFLNMRA